MKQIKLKQIGSFTKTHGIQGYLVLTLDESVTDDLLDKGLIEEEAVFVEIDGIPVPFFISENGIRDLNQNNILIKLDDVDNDKAKQIIPSRVFINTFYLKDVDYDSLFNPSDLIGFTIKDQTHGILGLVNDFIDLKENPLLSVDWKGKELLIPLNANFITAVEKENKLIDIELPEGYLDALLG